MGVWGVGVEGCVGCGDEFVGCGRVYGVWKVCVGYGKGVWGAESEWGMEGCVGVEGCVRCGRACGVWKLCVRCGRVCGV